METDPLRTNASKEALTLLLASGLDLAGEPPTSIHPVIWYGKLIKYLQRDAPEQPQAQLLHGTGMLLKAAPIAIVPATILQLGAGYIQQKMGQDGHPAIGNGIYALLVGTTLKPFFALKMLVASGHEVYAALKQHNLPMARHALRHLVSRDRSQLTEELITAAAIESLAENVNDSVVAPLFYYALAGLPGAAAYRLFNTFDSMIGYHGKYEYLGKAAAHLDDLLNLLPSRITALLIIVLAPLYSGDRQRAWRTWRRDAGNTSSPNAGQPMAAAAGALGIRLEKVDHYVLGRAEQAITPQHLQQAESMVWWVGASAFLLTLLVRIVKRRGRTTWNR